MPAQESSWNTLLPLVAIAATILTLVPACSHDRLSVVEVVAPPARKGTEACNFGQTRDAPGLAKGTLDVSMATSYQAVLLVESTSRTLVRGAHVTVTLEDGTVLDDYTNITASSIVGAGLVEVVAVSPTVANAFLGKVNRASESAAALAGLRLCDRDARRAVVAKMRVFGQVDGSNVESSEFSFPISACRGCLVEFACAAGVRARCDTIPFANEACNVAACYPGQESKVACQLCGADDACDSSKVSLCN